MLKLQIRGREWLVQFLPKISFEKKHGPSIMGITYIRSREIHFPKSPQLNTIIHELIHAYMAESNLQGCKNLNNEDFEEIIADTLSEFWEEITLHSRQIQNYEVNS